MSFEYKNILELTIAPDAFKDGDYVEVHRPGQEYAWRMSGAGLRALEKSERTAADLVLVNRIGLVGLNWNFPDLSATAYLYTMVSVTHGLVVLDSAIKQVADQVALLEGSDKHYRHTQGVPATQWTVHHNLGKFPAVTVTDTSGSEVEGEVTHINNNMLVLTFSATFGGYADLN
jgi:hypothetical protein